MEYTTLGRTNLKVSVAGLGCGGSSQIGRKTGASESDSVSLIKLAVDLGVNFIDTAKNYGTEPIVGAALKTIPRDQVVISTKSIAHSGQDHLPVDKVLADLNASLRNLGTDYVDVFHLHAVKPSTYDHVLNHIVPALLKEKEKGKFRFLGITESPPNDFQQLTLQRIIHDDCWDIVMLGFHMMNQKARERFFPHSQEKKIGTLLMFVVRALFSESGRLQKDIAELAAAGKVPEELAKTDHPLGFLIHEGGAGSVIEAAYRYARHEPGADVVLFGTGNKEHLKTNISHILKPPLPQADWDKLKELFSELEGVGLDLPRHVK